MDTRGIKKLSFNETVAMVNVRVNDGLSMSKDISSYTDTIRDKKSLLKRYGILIIKKLMEFV